MNPDNLIEEAERQSTSEEFFWAVGEMARQAKQDAEQARTLEDAIRWCIDRKVNVHFMNENITNILLPAPYHYMVWGPSFLDAVEQGRLWIEGFEHDTSTSVG